MEVKHIWQCRHVPTAGEDESFLEKHQTYMNSEGSWSRRRRSDRRGTVAWRQSPRVSGALCGSPSWMDSRSRCCPSRRSARARSRGGERGGVGKVDWFQEMESRRLTDIAAREWGRNKKNQKYFRWIIEQYRNRAAVQEIQRRHAKAECTKKGKVLTMIDAIHKLLSWVYGQRLGDK